MTPCLGTFGCGSGLLARSLPSPLADGRPGRSTATANECSPRNSTHLPCHTSFAYLVACALPWMSTWTVDTWKVVSCSMMPVNVISAVRGIGVLTGVSGHLPLVSGGCINALHPVDVNASMKDQNLFAARYKSRCESNICPEKCTS